MLYQTLSLTRALTIYVAQGLVFAVFLYLAYKILKRDKKRLNAIFAGFYLSPAIGLFLNFIYAPLDIPQILVVLNFLTNFGIFYAPIFMLVFELILLKSEKVITKIKQNLILIGYGIIMFCMIFFIFIPINGEYGVTMNEDTNWSPKWSTPFFLYLIFIESLAIIPVFFLAFQIYTKFEDNSLKRKWRSFIYGLIFLTIFMYGIFVSNFLADATFRLIMGIVGIILGIAGAFLMYRGVGRQLEK
ncbi:MAG: hypothetical protein ACFFKA_03180 [Candidatus Thorarchaeota archaeon]